MPRTRDQVRGAIAQLGLERDQIKAAEEAMALKIRDLLQEADEAGISRSDFARLLGVDRSVLYKVYLRE